MYSNVGPIAKPWRITSSYKYITFKVKHSSIISGLDVYGSHTIAFMTLFVHCNQAEVMNAPLLCFHEMQKRIKIQLNGTVYGEGYCSCCFSIFLQHAFMTSIKFRLFKLNFC